MTRKIGRYLFKIGNSKIHWCDEENIPILNENIGCSTQERILRIALPGDLRPAWTWDIKVLQQTISREYGSKIGEKIVPKDRLVLLNRIPGIDKIEEVIIDGHNIGKLYFDLSTFKYRFMLKSEGAKRINFFGGKKWILVDDGAVKALLKGHNLMCAGIIDADDSIEKGDYVYTVNKEGDVITIGKARLSSKIMKNSARGLAVKTKEIVNNQEIAWNPVKNSWDKVVEKNREIIEKDEEVIKQFIADVSTRYNKRKIISFSGGKDSLCLTSLILDAGIDNANIVFIDTKIEFPETIRYVYEVLSNLGVNDRLILKENKKDFWDIVKRLGPPSRDFRWCSRVCKLMPMRELIKEKIKGGCLTFVGQRKYESFSRAAEAKISETYFVKGQTKVSPIKDWNALEVWVYISLKKLKVNPLYYMGFNRIGCYMCPASDLADLENVKLIHPNLWERWQNILIQWKEKKKYGEKWIKYGLWRWRNLPGYWKNVIG